VSEHRRWRGQCVENEEIRNVFVLTEAGLPCDSI
jgi:hypothetical protein